jgi:tetratricopeptide (TPR) repeat protein/predicted Ser/Thr protein kinase
MRIDDAALDRLSRLFAEEREEKRAAAERLVERLKAGGDAEFDHRFGKYGLIRELGRGGLGRVWLAWDPDLKRFVALKVLAAASDDHLRRLRREAQIAARLDHPRIAAVYEVGEAHGVSFIAMKFLEGRSLEGATLEPAEAARVVRDAARVLQWAHERGVVHRDVKPGNLMLCSGEVHVVDFGLAKPMEGGESLTGGAIVGTLAYMSREQAAGEAVGPESDVYSLGATLYRLATGRAPVEARSTLELLSKLESPPPSPRSLNPALSAALEAVILKAMDARAHRTRTAGEMADELDRVLRGEPVSGPGFRWKTWHRVAAAAVVLVAFAAWTVWRRQQSAAERLAAADAALKLGRYDDVAKALDEAAAAGANVEERRVALKAARLLAASRRIEKARSLIEQSRVNLYKKGATLSQTFFRDLDAATASVRESITLADTAEARIVLGRIEMVLGNYEAARREYGRAVELDRASLVAGRLGQARSYVEEAAEELFAGREEQGTFLLASARRIFEEMPGLSRRVKEGELENELVEAWKRVAAGDYEGAIEYASARTSSAEEFFVVLGLAQFRKEPGREALQSLTAAIDVRPNYYQAFLWRGLMLKQMSGGEYARADVERAVAIHPRYASAWLALAEMKEEAGDVEGAAECRKRAGRK